MIKYAVEILSLCFFRLYFHLPAIKTYMPTHNALLGLARYCKGRDVCIKKARCAMHTKKAKLTSVFNFRSCIINNTMWYKILSFYLVNMTGFVLS